MHDKQRVRRNNSVQETFWEWGAFWFISSAKSPEEQKNHSFVREVKLALKEGRAQLQFLRQSCVSGTEQLHTFTPPPKETTTGSRIGPVDYLQRNNHHIGLVAEEAMTMATEELKRKGNESRKKPAAAEEERRSCCFFKHEKQFRKRVRNPL